MLLRDLLGTAALAASLVLATSRARAEDDTGWVDSADANVPEADDSAPPESGDPESPDERAVPPPPPPRGAETLDDPGQPTPVHIFEPEQKEEADPKSYAGPAAEPEATAKDGSSVPDAPAPRQYTGPPTLLGNEGTIAYGGYGGVDVRWSRIAGHDAVLVGGEAALLLDHRLAIGVGGYGLSTLVPGPRSSRGNRSYVGMGYGGLVVRHNFVNTRLVYLSFGTLVGAGGVGFLERVGEYEFEFDESQFDEDAFFVVEPSLGLHVNVTRWMRVGASVAYRYTKGIDCEGFTDRDFRGPSAGGHVQFGWF